MSDPTQRLKTALLELAATWRKEAAWRGPQDAAGAIYRQCAEELERGVGAPERPPKR